MDKEETVVEETLDTPEGEVVTPESNQDEATKESGDSSDDLLIEGLKKKAEISDNYKIRAEKAESDRKTLEAKLSKLSETGEKPTLDVEDYIDISASLEGLDQREKEYLSQQHKQTGKPLKEIRKNEDFVFWQTAYRQKVEKDKTLAPSNSQGETDKPRTLVERLANASMEEKEKILEEVGLFHSPRPKTDRVNIGDVR